MTFNNICHKLVLLHKAPIDTSEKEQNVCEILASLTTVDMTPNKLITRKQMWSKTHQQMGQGGRVNFLSKLKVFWSEQSSLPGELAATFIASPEAPKIELLYKETTPRNSE